jgi:hypothetical protein
MTITPVRQRRDRIDFIGLWQSTVWKSLLRSLGLGSTGINQACQIDARRKSVMKFCSGVKKVES